MPVEAPEYRAPNLGESTLLDRPLASSIGCVFVGDEVTARRALVGLLWLLAFPLFSLFLATFDPAPFPKADPESIQRASRVVSRRFETSLGPSGDQWEEALFGAVRDRLLAVPRVVGMIDAPSAFEALADRLIYEARQDLTDGRKPVISKLEDLKPIEHGIERATRLYAFMYVLAGTAVAIAVLFLACGCRFAPKVFASILILVFAGWNLGCLLYADQVVSLVDKFEKWEQVPSGTIDLALLGPQRESKSPDTPSLAQDGLLRALIVVAFSLCVVAFAHIRSSYGSPAFRWTNARGSDSDSAPHGWSKFLLSGRRWRWGPRGLHSRLQIRGRGVRRLALAAFLALLAVALIPLFVPAGALVLVFATREFVVARRLLAARAVQLRQSDKRRPVLLLRSFADDGIELQRGLFGSLVPFRFSIPRRQTFESWLARSLWSIGPVIAIGKPGEEMPELGAARQYVLGEDWHSVVQGLVGECALAVILLGEGEGLRWEVQQVLTKGCGRSVLIAFPPMDEESALRRWERFKGWVSEFNIPVGELGVSPTSTRFLVLSPIARCLAVTSRGTNEVHFRAALEAAGGALGLGIHVAEAGS